MPLSHARTHTQGLEQYSTVLWHLRRETELAHLAHEALAIDRAAPQAWCAVGNALSLARDHGAAVACFQRAMQLDPAFAYAATLAGACKGGVCVLMASGVHSGCLLAARDALFYQAKTAHRNTASRLSLTQTHGYTHTGHEYLASEDLTAAMTAYRNALRMDGRHYNAL